MLGEENFLYPINISEHQRQQSRRPPRNFIIFEWPTTLNLEKIWCLKDCFFDRAACFAVDHMLGEENFFISNKHIWTPTTAKQTATSEFYHFLVTHNPNFRANMMPQRSDRFLNFDPTLVPISTRKKGGSKFRWVELLKFFKETQEDSTFFSKYSHI